MDKITFEQIKEDYHNSDICMSEFLASVPPLGLNMEEAFNLYIAARKWADRDRFFVWRDFNDREELGVPADDYNFDQLILSRFKNLDELKTRVEKIAPRVLSIEQEEMEHRDDPETGFKQPDLSLLLDLDPGDNGEYSHLTLYYYTDRQGNMVITETTFCWE